MKNVLVTGADGFIGRNVTPLLREVYSVSTPTRAELDLCNAEAVMAYLCAGRYDAVIHLATPTGHNPVDKPEVLLERSLRAFHSLACCSELYGKMIYIGSGAEYGKHRAIVNIREEEFGKEIPKDPYGFARYLMSELAEKHGNIVNLRVFACHGPQDQPHKLIPHIMGCIREGKPITLRQDARFDFLYVTDILSALKYFLENRANYGAYNLCSGETLFISSIAEEVRRQMKSDMPVVFEKAGLNMEYTGSNARLKRELPEWNPCSMGEGIRRILEYENRRA